MRWRIRRYASASSVSPPLKRRPAAGGRRFGQRGFRVDPRMVARIRRGGGGLVCLVVGCHWFAFFVVSIPARPCRSAAFSGRGLSGHRAGTEIGSSRGSGVLLRIARGKDREKIHRAPAPGKYSLRVGNLAIVGDDILGAGKYHSHPFRRGVGDTRFLVPYRSGAGQVVGHGANWLARQRITRV